MFTCGLWQAILKFILFLVMKVDVVYVGTIHPHHLTCVLKMFEAKKPVLCEKPLTMNAKDTATLIEAAQGKGLFLMEVSSHVNS